MFSIARSDPEESFQLLSEGDESDKLSANMSVNKIIRVNDMKLT